MHNDAALANVAIIDTSGTGWTRLAMFRLQQINDERCKRYNTHEAHTRKTNTQTPRCMLTSSTPQLYMHYSSRDC